MDIEMEKMVLIEDIHRLLEGISDTKKIKSAWDTYDKFSQICTFTRMLLKNPICKPILNELHKNRSKDDLLIDHRRVRISEPWYAFYRLYIVNKAWECISKKDENINSFVFFDDDDEQIKSESKILDDLKADDSSSSYVTSDGIGWECIFDYDEFVSWSATLGEFLIPRIKTITTKLNNELIVLPTEFEFKSEENILINGNIKTIIKGEINTKILKLLFKNPGYVVTSKQFEENKISKEQIKHAIYPIRQKLKYLQVPIEIYSEGSGGYSLKRTK